MSDEILALPYPKYKLAIPALLTLNVFAYAILDTWVSAVDALVWLVLLVMFELETINASPLSARILHQVRNALIAVIVLVLVIYIHDSEWLDVSNSMLWFAVIALLELEVRWPDKVQKYEQAFWLTTIAVFTGLIGLVGAWIWQANWLDAYDAALWIAAFAVIELDIFRFLKRKRD